jgi:hypothetical protein
MQGLMLEMISDLYEIAEALAPKTGMGMAPAATVAEWLKQRNN